MQPAWLGEPLLFSASWREPSGSMTRNPADRTVRATNRPELLQQIREASRRYGAKTQLALALGYTRGTIHEKLKRDDAFTDDELERAADRKSTRLHSSH